MSRIAFISRILLFCLNLAVLLISVGLVSWGSFMLDTPFERKLKDVVFNYNSSEPLADDKFYLRAWIYATFWSIYGLCIGGVLIAIIGIIGTISHRKAVLATFLVLMVPYILMQLGGAITVWAKRGNLRRLIYQFANDIYSTDSIFDIGVIQDTYSCCGVQNGLWRCPNSPPCDESIFDSVDNTMMIAGLIFFIPILLMELAILIFPVLILKFEPKREDVKLDNQ